MALTSAVAGVIGNFVLLKLTKSVDSRWIYLTVGCFFGLTTILIIVGLKDINLDS